MEDAFFPFCNFEFLNIEVNCFLISLIIFIEHLLELTFSLLASDEKLRLLAESKDKLYFKCGPLTEKLLSILFA